MTLTFLILNFLIACLFPIMLGYIFLKFFKFQTPFLSSFALSLFLGLGVISLWMLFLLILNLPLMIEFIIYPLGFFSAAAIFVLYFRGCQDSCLDFCRPQGFSGVTSSRKWMIFGALLFIFFQIYFIFKATLIWPMSTWDGIYAIAVKSKYFFFGGQLSGLKNFYMTTSYPISMELCLTWVAMVFNQWDDQWLKLFFPLMLIAYMSLQYEFVKNFSSDYKALQSCALTLCPYFLVYHSSIEYRSVFFMIYNLLTVFLIFQYFHKNYSPALILAGIFAGIGAFIKLEGTGHFLIYLFLIVYLQCKQKVKVWQGISNILTRFVFPFLFFTLPFWFVKNHYGLGTFEGRLQLEFAGFENRIIPILNVLFRELFVSGNWSILWFVLLVFAVTQRRKNMKSDVIQYFGITLFLYFALYFLLCLFTSTFDSLCVHSATTFARTILHFFPLCPILIALLVDSQKDSI